MALTQEQINRVKGKTGWARRKRDNTLIGYPLVEYKDGQWYTTGRISLKGLEMSLDKRHAITQDFPRQLEPSHL